MLQGMIEDLGYRTEGPCSTLQEGVRCAREMTVDAAFVDLILQDEPAYEVGEILKERGVPFTFATGLSDQALGDYWKEHPFVLHKPYGREEVARLLSGMLDAANEHRASKGCSTQ
jgi:hypothetical protein